VWYFEKEATHQGCRNIAGIDEAGRGPLAGPVVSAAVILPSTFDDADITDSKKLSPKKRQRLYDTIYARATAVGIGIVDAIEIDRINILQASLLSMAMAVKNLVPRPDFLLIDGIFGIASELPQKPIKKGDALSISIAAASIVAKVSRDRLMQTYHHYYPQFDFPRHKGYPTKAHKEAIRTFGCSPIHRKSFKGVKEYT
jgi:ribonuclease HII